MLANATRICEAKFGNLLLYEDDAFRTRRSAQRAAGLGRVAEARPVIRPSPKSRLGRVVADEAD